MSDDDEVGYGKPPKHSQFKKGQSGNPKGRPKGHKNFKTDLLETLKAPVKVKSDGRPRVVTTQMAALLHLRQKALGLDPKALYHLLEYARLINVEEIPEDAAVLLVDSDRAILDAFESRIRLRQGKQSPLLDEPETPREDDDAGPA